MPGTKAIWLATIVASLCLLGCIKKPPAIPPAPLAPAMRTCPDGTAVPFSEQCSRPLNASIQSDPSSPAVCAGQPLRFTASPALDGATYRWTINGQPAGSASSLSIPTKGPGPGTYTVGLTITAPGFTDFTASTTFAIRPYVPPVGSLMAEPSEILIGGKSTLHLEATSGQCGGEIREVRYSASEGAISGTTFDSSSAQFERSGREQRKPVTITAQLRDLRGVITVSTIILVYRAASVETLATQIFSAISPQQRRQVSDVIFPANRSEVNNCGMRVLLEGLKPYVDRDPAGRFF
jgi:hypothetical protein